MGRQSRRKKENRQQNHVKTSRRNSQHWLYELRKVIYVGLFASAVFLGKSAFFQHTSHEETPISSSSRQEKYDDICSLEDLVVNPNYKVLDTLTIPIKVNSFIDSSAPVNLK